MRTIKDHLEINTYYTRSVNLERDRDQLEIIRSYVPTFRAQSLITRVIEGLPAKPRPRAWSLIGPYGSGKSSFSNFLGNLLSNPDRESTVAASEVLDHSCPELFAKWKKQDSSAKGFFIINITGSPEPFSIRLVQALDTAARDYWSQKKGANPKFMKSLTQLAESDEAPSHRAIIQIIEQLQSALAQHASGILLTVDEFGKFLEFEATQYGQNDLSLIQTLAEHASGSNQVNLFFFVLLHQSFENYAAGLGTTMKNEWAKIQGRFEDIPFLEGPEQTLRIMSRVFERDFTLKQERQLNAQFSAIIEVLHSQNALPKSLEDHDALEVLSHCYPLHPLTALMLPLLCQKVAQNERTLFSYLGSSEEFGLRSTIDTFSKPSDLILPCHVYDYFITNQPSSINDKLAYRRWVEVASAIERLENAPDDYVQLLKTIGILNILGASSGLKAAPKILETLFDSKTIVGGLKYLTEKSILTYRKFNNEYRVWQGSDFDFEAAFQEQLSANRHISIPEKLNERDDLRPIVARKYSITNGSLRFFHPVFSDLSHFEDTVPPADHPRIILFLAADREESQLLQERTQTFHNESDFIAIIPPSNQLAESVKEVHSLTSIYVQRQELQIDPIASKEIRERLDHATFHEKALLRRLFDEPGQLSWFWNGQPIVIENKRAFQAQLSNIFKKIYTKAPCIHNELINKDKPSSQANAARNKLLNALTHSSHLEDLGFEKFPPEKSIYRSIFKKSGMHVKADKNWELAPDHMFSDGDHCNLQPVWDRIRTFLASTTDFPRSFADLDPILRAAPFGVKKGLLPILYYTAILKFKDELGIHEDRLFLADFTEDHVTRFIKKPEHFTFQFFQIQGANASLIKEYSLALFGKEELQEDSNILHFVRPIAKFLGGLPNYTKNTKNLSTHGQAFRRAFELAKSPIRLLLKDLPAALEDSSPDQERLATRLTDVLRELKYNYAHMIDHQKVLLAKSFGQRPELELKELRRNISGRVAGLEQYTVDIEGLKAFIMRLQNREFQDSEWQENILTFLGQVPTEKWQDSNRDNAEYRLSVFSTKIKDLEKLRIQREKTVIKGKNDFEVVLIKYHKQGEAECEEVVSIDRETAKRIEGTKTKIIALLEKLDDEALAIAALAEAFQYLFHDKENL